MASLTKSKPSTVLPTGIHRCSLADIRTRIVETCAVSGQRLVRGRDDTTHRAGQNVRRFISAVATVPTHSRVAGRTSTISSAIFFRPTKSLAITLTGGAGRDTYYFLPVRQGAEPVVADVITGLQAGAGGGSDPPDDPAISHRSRGGGTGWSNREGDDDRHDGGATSGGPIQVVADA